MMKLIVTWTLLRVLVLLLIYQRLRLKNLAAFSVIPELRMLPCLGHFPGYRTVRRPI